MGFLHAIHLLGAAFVLVSNECTQNFLENRTGEILSPEYPYRYPLKECTEWVLPNGLYEDNYTLVVYLEKIETTYHHQGYEFCLGDLEVGGANFCTSPDGACIIVQKQYNPCGDSAELVRCKEKTWFGGPSYPQKITLNSRSYNPNWPRRFKLRYDYISCKSNMSTTIESDESTTILSGPATVTSIEVSEQSNNIDGSSKWFKAAIGLIVVIIIETTALLTLFALRCCGTIGTDRESKRMESRVDAALESGNACAFSASENRHDSASDAIYSVVHKNQVPANAGAGASMREVVVNELYTMQ